MANSENKFRVNAFCRSFSALFIVANLFQLMLAKDELTSFKAVWATIVDNLAITLGITSIAAGFFVLLSRKEDEEA